MSTHLFQLLTLNANICNWNSKEPWYRSSELKTKTCRLNVSVNCSLYGTLLLNTGWLGCPLVSPLQQRDTQTLKTSSIYTLMLPYTWVLIQTKNVHGLNSSRCLTSCAEAASSAALSAFSWASWACWSPSFSRSLSSSSWGFIGLVSVDTSSRAFSAGLSWSLAYMKRITGKTQLHFTGCFY